MLRLVHLQAQQHSQIPDFKHNTRAHLHLKGWREGVMKKVSEDSGYLDNLLPIDIVLADKGLVNSWNTGCRSKDSCYDEGQKPN